jgi:hypothetical protein
VWKILYLKREEKTVNQIQANASLDAKQNDLKATSS